MKIFIYGMIFYFLFVFSSCGNVDKPSSSHVFNGIFKTETTRVFTTDYYSIFYR